jgi:hypothetical protein
MKSYHSQYSAISKTVGYENEENQKLQNRIPMPALCLKEATK